MQRCPRRIVLRNLVPHEVKSIFSDATEFGRVARVTLAGLVYSGVGKRRRVPGFKFEKEIAQRGRVAKIFELLEFSRFASREISKVDSEIDTSSDTFKKTLLLRWR